MTAFVSILPQACFVERVAGERVRVEVLVGAGQSPETYEPTARQMARLAEARIYFRTGLPFERSLAKKIERTFKSLRMVDLREGVTLRQMEDSHRHDDHAPDDGETREHEARGEPDPHVWLDPMRVKIMARTICEELSRLEPPQAAEFQKNLEAFHAELDAVDRRITHILAPAKGRRFYVYHPSYGYFAERYGMQQAAIEVSGRPPSVRELGSLIETGKADRVPVIFVQPQSSKAPVQAIASALGARVETLDPLARDYVENLERMAAAIAAAVEGQNAAAANGGKDRVRPARE